jgi:cell division protein FtsL
VRRRRRLAAAGSGLLLALSLFALVSVHVLLSQGQFTLQRLQTQANDQDAAYQRLRLRVAELEAPQRIVAEAQKRGMVQPPVVTYLAPTPDSSAAGSASAPAAAPDPGGATSWSTVKPHLAGRP